MNLSSSANSVVPNPASTSKSSIEAKSGERGRSGIPQPRKNMDCKLSERRKEIRTSRCSTPSAFLMV